MNVSRGYDASRAHATCWIGQPATQLCEDGGPPQSAQGAGCYRQVNVRRPTRGTFIVGRSAFRLTRCDQVMKKMTISDEADVFLKP